MGVLFSQAQGISLRHRLTDDDNISTASTDDMFAFSQIVAGGQNPLQVASLMEKEAKAKAAAQPRIAGLD